jgi:hypothetical protein
MSRVRVRGVLIAPDTVRLQHPLPLPEGAEVEVLVEAPPMRGSFPLMLATLEAIHARLEAAGHRPPTPKEVLERIEAERASWEKEQMPSGSRPFPHGRIWLQCPR